MIGFAASDHTGRDTIGSGIRSTILASGGD
jgi:hypothetical protein